MGVDVDFRPARRQAGAAPTRQLKAAVKVAQPGPSYSEKPGPAFYQAIPSELRQSRLQAALAADPTIDSRAITIHMLSPVAVLEGYISNAEDRDKAISTAAMIVGFSNVHDRMLSHVTS